jgi:hypothetical protein
MSKGRFSVKELETELTRKFRRIDKRNVWEAYEYLKEYCGIKNQTLSPEEYENTIKDISGVVGI